MLVFDYYLKIATHPIVKSSSMNICALNKYLSRPLTICNIVNVSNEKKRISRFMFIHMIKVIDHLF